MLLSPIFVGAVLSKKFVQQFMLLLKLKGLINEYNYTKPSA